jgi:glycine/D-amino acid oxidase-like deaminating enzyme
VENPFLSSLSFDVVIVRAGIVGAACAREFAESGLRTALIESEAVRGGATAAGMGHLAVMHDSEAQSLSPAILSSYGISSQCDFHRTLNIFRAVPSGLLLMKSRCEKCCESSSLTRIEELQLRSSIRDLSQTPSQICGLEWRRSIS